MAYNPGSTPDCTATLTFDLSSSPPSPGPPATPYQSTTRSHFGMLQNPSPSTSQTPRVGLGLGDVEFNSFESRRKDRQRDGKRRSSFDDPREHLPSSFPSSSSHPSRQIIPSQSAPRLSSLQTSPRPQQRAPLQSRPTPLHSVTPRQSASTQPAPHLRPSSAADPRPTSHPSHHVSPSKRLLPTDSTASSLPPPPLIPPLRDMSRETHRELPPGSGKGLDILSSDAIGEVEKRLGDLCLEWGLDEEEGDDESKEMQALRELKRIVQPIFPTLQAVPKLQDEVEALVSLRRTTNVQDSISTQMMQQSRAIHDVERQTTLDVISRQLETARSSAVEARQRQRSDPHPRAAGGGIPGQGRKELGFDEDLEVVDTQAYNNLIKQWMELQAENRKNVGEKNVLIQKLRESDVQVKALSQELYFLRASALQAPQSDTTPTLPHPKSNANFATPASSQPSSSRHRPTLGDARTEHLLLASRRLRTLQRTNPDAGLLRSADFTSAGFEPPSYVAPLVPAPPSPGRDRTGGAPGSRPSGAGGGEDRPKNKVGGRGKGKKTLATAAAAQGTSSSNMPPFQTPSVKARAKKHAADAPSAASTPGASFDDLLFAARVCGRSNVDTNPPMSTARDDDGASPSSDELDEPAYPSANINDSPKRRRVAPSSASAASWVPGDHPPQPNLPYALDLLALASFGSPAAVVGPDHLQSQQQQQEQHPTSIASSSRLGGLLGSGGHHPSSAASPSFPSSDSLEPALVLHSSRQSQAQSYHHPPSPPSYYQSPHLDQTPSSAYPATYPSPHNTQHFSSSGYQHASTATATQYDQQQRPNPSLSTTMTAAVPLAPSFSSPPTKGPAVNKLGAAGMMSEPAKRIRSPYLKWTEAEDELLARGVAKYGTKWDAVSKAVPSRSYHQCRQRWLRKMGVFDHKPAPSSASATQSPLASVKQSPRA